MNILIIHAHNCNRGDEAAVKSMVDEILEKYPFANITISVEAPVFYPKMSERVKQIIRFPKWSSKIAQVEYLLSFFCGSKVSFTKEGRNFITILKNSDLVIHAPGGPSIGDIYLEREWLYLSRLDIVRRLNIPYMFYAPSMGPFYNEKNNELRKKVLLGAEKIILRDPISIKYLKEFLPEIKVEQALDSALQHDIDKKSNEETLNQYKTLNEFINNHEKIIGITITDLKWHPKHKFNSAINNIKSTFIKFIKDRINEGYGIVFIPQLYGEQNDIDLMNEYMLDKHTFMVEANKECYDSYFQQYLIGKLYAVVGMRYHSNIFSAKMGTPFVSVSYEQKMEGFMNSIGLNNYCISFENLSYDKLNEKFSMLEKNYILYKEKLNQMHEYMKNESYKSTKVVIDILEKHKVNGKK